MSEGDGMAEVSEADREKAMDLLPDAIRLYYPDVLDAVAAALAEERQKARAPFVRLADEIQAAAGDRQDVVSATMRDDAALIRVTLDDN